MAWKNIGFNGKLTEVTMQQSALGRGASRFGVRGVNDFALTVTGFSGVVSPGEGHAYGITSIQDTPTNLTFGTVSTGTRWDTVALRRDSTPPTGGVASIVVLPGGPTQGLALGLQNDPGVTTDQPLWLVPVTSAGAGVPVDMRVWWNDGGLVCAGPAALTYMNELGTYIHVLSESLSYRRKKVGNGLQWVVENTGPAGPTPEISIGTVTTLPAGAAATVTRAGTDEKPILNLGLPQGVQGLPSPVATLKGTVAAQANLPSTGNTKNDAYIVGAGGGGNLWFWNGTAWQDLGPFQGPAGPAGTTTWAGITDKPATFAPTIGTTATTAKAGNYTPTVAGVTGLEAALSARLGYVKVVTGNETRPAGYDVVNWLGGTTRPTNAPAGDIWYKAAA